MTPQEKKQVIEELTETLTATNVFYLADTSELSAEKTSALRRACFKSNIQMRVVKNTLLRKAMESIEDRNFEDIYEAISGPISLMVSDTGNAPAKLIQDFRKKHDKPVLRAAYIEEESYIGDEMLKTLTEIKSKEEVIGDIISLLQSPARNVISALQGGGSQKIAGLVKALSEREG